MESRVGNIKQLFTCQVEFYTLIYQDKEHPFFRFAHWLVTPLLAQEMCHEYTSDRLKEIRSAFRALNLRP